MSPPPFSSRRIGRGQRAGAPHRRDEAGNVLIIILGAIVLLGLLTAAVQYTSQPEGAGVEGEQLVLAATRVSQYASELEHGVDLVIRNGYSESDVRFANPENTDYGDLSADADPTNQVFHKSGGAASWRAPPAGVNDGSAWEFYGGTDLPNAGSSRAELIAVLPNVTQQFCNRINEQNGLDTATQPEDDGTSSPAGANAGDCLYQKDTGRFDDGQQFYATANTADAATFVDRQTAAQTTKPVLEGCVLCERNDGGSNLHYFHVLLAR